MFLLNFLNSSFSKSLFSKNLSLDRRKRLRFACWSLTLTQFLNDFNALLPFMTGSQYFKLHSLKSSLAATTIGEAKISFYFFSTFRGAEVEDLCHLHQ